MSKHFSIFQTAAQWDADKNSLDYPHVSLIDTTGDLHYYKYNGKEIADAPFGSIIMGEVSTDTLFYIDNSEYNLTDYPFESYKPIGICIYDKASNANEQTIIMSVQFPTYPTLGGTQESNTYSYIKWGFNNTNLSQTITDIRSSTATSLYINKEVKKITNSPWQTEEQVATDGSEPAAFIVCWRFKTVGTKEGDWMLPSKYDYGKYFNNYQTIENVIKNICTVLRGLGYVTTYHTEGYIANEYDNTNATAMSWPSYGGVKWAPSSKSSNSYGLQRPVMVLGIEEV